MSKIVTTQLSINQQTHVQTDSLEIGYVKTFANSINPSLSLSNNCSIQLPNPCYLFDKSESCANRIVVQQSFSMSGCLYGRNGFHELGLDGSRSASLSFHDGIQQIKVNTNSSYPIILTLARDSSIKKPDFIEQNISRFTNVDFERNQLMTFNFSLRNPRSSFHFHVKPSETDTSYLIVLKYGLVPVLNGTDQVFDSFKIACYNSDLKSEDGEEFMLLFSNMHSNQNLDTIIGIGLRELNSNETKSLCGAIKTVTDNPPVLSSQISAIPTSNQIFTAKFSIRAFSSGCYYFDTKTGFWLSDGVEVLEETNFSYTVCSALHLTEYAGGFIVIPPGIDFDTVWAKASPTRNPTIYATVITIVGLYFIMCGLCRFMDIRDREKKGLSYLANNRSDNLYEIVVFTGNRPQSQTDSKVRMVICGNFTESKIIYLRDRSRRAFRRGGIDTFIASNDA
jgi:hypothetical protein